jgi:GNAT superfamily N-acetyltransferase
MLIERAAPGRWDEVIAPSAAELAATLVIRFPIREGSAKVRKGPPLDPAHEANGGVWAGVLPLRLVAGAPLVDALDDVPPRLSPAVAARAASMAPDVEWPQPASEPALRVPYERTPDVAHLRGVLASAEPLRLSSDRARIDVARVHAFLSNESYWAAGLSEESFRRACAASLCFGVYQGREQLAFARVVSDFARFAYLADVFVLATLRGRGLGKALVREIMQHPQLAQVETWLLGTRDAHGLYARFGFVPMPEGRYMARRVDPSSPRAFECAAGS